MEEIALEKRNHWAPYIKALLTYHAAQGQGLEEKVCEDRLSMRLDSDPRLAHPQTPGYWLWACPLGIAHQTFDSKCHEHTHQTFDSKCYEHTNQTFDPKCYECATQIFDSKCYEHTHQTFDSFDPIFSIKNIWGLRLSLNEVEAVVGTFAVAAVTQGFGQ